MNARLRRGGPLLRAALASALGLAVAAGAVVWTRTEILALRYELSRLFESEASLRNEVEKLRVEAAALTAPDRVERRARELGLRYPQPGEVIFLDAAEPAAGTTP